ncbi:N-acetylglucosamine kinase-like BadF-type ATPase [Paenibacillus phyllosphaerae]|uniref:N-acetylglucosamine kinase-like BadF-type ATPase n=1 Tax=Paenibacillus phyllosphaerae TaxID=274593 RepID=A0A7W5FMG3_9BACL|nr:BadF/BadG/BcrA/BcrD ATPase family protein [Paenibacillus phyllosphaerae]MBB3110098.1 N-acetylglucosamine kinase-like BadF-type ATPase [Paenibacillus phyllosphaerae]
MNYYLGVDGGGSKTIAVVADQQGRIIGRGRSGCGNHQIGVEVAERSIREAVQEAMQEANVTIADIDFAMFGLAGADREADFTILRPLVANLGFPRHDVVCDTVIGLRAGTRQPDGVVVICGSGTNCFGVNARGQSLQVGGFGYQFGDFGGGGELAVEVFRTVIRAWEGREEPTRLTQLTLSELGYPDVQAMFDHYLDEGKRVPHTLAKILFEAGDEDAPARQILERQGRELGLAASAVIRKLNMGADTFDLVMVGSVLTRSDNRHIAAVLEPIVQAEAPGCSLRVLDMEPVAGAILLAMERSGTHADSPIYAQLCQDLAVKELTTEWITD